MVTPKRHISSGGATECVDCMEELLNGTDIDEARLRVLSLDV
jgi:hypothetical protein